MSGHKRDLEAETAYRRRGVSLAEAIVSIGVVGTMLVAALNTVGSMRRSEATEEVQIRAQLLAQELMSEILSRPYADPDAVGSVDPSEIGNTARYLMGPDWGEWSSQGRNLYDDVDDYAFWSASPPENRDGSTIPGTTGFKRTARVQCVDGSDMSSGAWLTETGLKSITVTVAYENDTVVTLTAYKSLGLPAQIRPLSVLMIVTDATLPLTQDQQRQTLLESWGHTVTRVDSSISQTDFETALAANDVVYISAELSTFPHTASLYNTTVGLVNESAAMAVTLGLTSSTQNADVTDIKILNSTHSITEGYSTGYRTVFSSKQGVYALSSSLPTGAQVLAETTIKQNTTAPALVVLGSGQALLNGNATNSRFVQLPWGRSGYDVNTLNSDGQTILNRALYWAAGF